MVKQTVTAPVDATVKTKKEVEVIEATFDNLEFETPETDGGYDEIFFVKIKTKDAAYLEFSKKVGDKILKDPRTTIQAIDGHPTKIILDSYTYDNKEVKVFKIYLTKELGGKSVLFIISSSYTQVGRGIINGLLAHDKPIDKLHLAVYLNQQGYASVKMLIDGKKTMWKYSIDEQRKHIETITNKKGEFISNDYSELDDKLHSEMQNHLGILFPEQDHFKFTEPKPEQTADGMLGVDEATFGEDDGAENFFELNTNE